MNHTHGDLHIEGSVVEQKATGSIAPSAPDFSATHGMHDGSFEPPQDITALQRKAEELIYTNQELANGRTRKMSARRF